MTRHEYMTVADVLKARIVSAPTVEALTMVREIARDLADAFHFNTMFDAGSFDRDAFLSHALMTDRISDL